MKYMGSKRRLAKDLAPILNQAIKDTGADLYLEPFVGGANMIQHIEAPRKIGSDYNKYLIALFKAMLDGWEPPADIDRELYDKIRQNPDEYELPLAGAAAFFASYNGIFFGSYAKPGKKRHYYDEAKRNVQKQLPHIRDVEFRRADYREYSDVEGAVIYCDPPYADTTGYSRKNKKDAGGFDHAEFWQWVRAMSYKNEVYVSEYTAPDDFEIVYEKDHDTSLGNRLNKGKNTKRVERLYTLAHTPEADEASEIAYLLS